MTDFEKLQAFRTFLQQCSQKHYDELTKDRSYKQYEQNDLESFVGAFQHLMLALQLRMGPDTHEYLKKNGILETWPTEAMFTISSAARLLNQKSVVCPVHYLASFSQAQHMPKDGSITIERKHEIILRGQYNADLFTPKKTTLLDPEYRDMMKQINSLSDEKYMMEKKVKDLNISVDFFYVIDSLFHSLRAIFFSFLVAVIAALIPAFLLQAAGLDESVAGPVALIVIIIAFFIAARSFGVADLIDDVYSYKTGKKELKAAKKYLKVTYPKLLQESLALQKSPQFAQAQARNEKLYEEEVAFARLWQSKWLKYCMEHPDPDFYV